jgi:hypothetical protein
LRLRVDGVETQVMVAARANVRALQNRCLAVRTHPGPAEAALASYGHRLAAVYHAFDFPFLIVPAKFHMPTHA